MGNWGLTLAIAKGKKGVFLSSELANFPNNSFLKVKKNPSYSKTILSFKLVITPSLEKTGRIIIPSQPEVF